MGPRWGFDIRGEYIEGIVLEDASSTRILRRMRVPAEYSKGYYHLLGQIHKLVEVLSAEVGVRPASLGISTWGHLDPITKTIKNAGTPVLDGKPLLGDLETYIGVPARLSNAANCLALAETRFGTVPEVVPGAKCVLGVLIEDRVDGGIVFNGRILGGRQGIAGSWGHNYLDDSGGTCDCGRHGCTQTVLSDQALAEYYSTQGGRAVGMEDILSAADRHDDAAAAQTLERFVYHLAKALGPAINLLDPECVVIGGTMSAADAVFEQGPELLKRFVHNSRLDTPLLRPQLGRSASMYGAALL